MRASTSNGTASGAETTHKWLCRIFGILVCAFAALLLADAVMAMVARSTGWTFDGWFEAPAAISVVYGPYGCVTALAFLAQGVLVLRQRTRAAVAVIGLTLVDDALSALIPAINVDGKYVADSGTIIVYAILIGFTVAIMLARQAAGRRLTAVA